MGAKRWFVWTMAFSALTCALVAAFNFVVDPWGLNGIVSINDFNKLKPDPISIGRLHKAYAEVRVKPAAIVLGSSTVEHAIDVRHPAWHGFAPAYNLSIPGSTIGEIDAFLRAAHRVSPIRFAIIGLDFLAFNAHRERNAQTQQALAAMGSAWVRSQPYWTRSMLTASLDTLLRQPALFEYFLDDGRSSEQAFEQWRMKSDGHHNLFALSVRQTVNRLVRNPARRFEFQRGQEKSTLEELHDLLEFAASEKIRLQLVIPPSHAWQLETVRALGLWPMFEYWKQQMAYLVEPYSRSGQAALWDFADYSEITDESVPQRGDLKTEMQWFWDPLHFKVALGNLVQDRISGIKNSEVSLPAAYGLRLDAQNVNAQLLAIRERQRVYRESHPQDLAEIETIVAQTLQGLRSQ